MQLFRRVRVIRTRREPPRWLDAVQWAVMAATGLALCLVVARSGYRIAMPPAVAGSVELLGYVVLVLFAADVILGYLFAPSRWQHFRQRWLDALLLAAALVAFAISRSHLSFIVARQALVAGRAFTRTHRFAGFLEELRQQPMRLLVLGFLALISVGTLLLTFPAATSDGRGTSLVDALFTATSAISTTGLAVVDTGSHYSTFGQLVVLALVQVGGLGYMVFIGLVVFMLGGNISIGDRVVLRQGINPPSALDMRKYTGVVILLTVLIELAGAAGLFLCFRPGMSTGRALYFGVFHSISAFCTAGFGLLADNLTLFRHSPFANLVTDFLCIAGAVGFFVLYDLYAQLRSGLRHAQRRLSIHSRFVLTMTGMLLVSGAVVVLFAEWRDDSMTVAGRLLTASFQAVSAGTTTGYNSVDIGAMAPASLMVLALLMFIGSSPGGTGGGIKTTTFGTMVLYLFAFLRGRRHVTLYRHRVPSATVRTAFIVGLASSLWVVTILLILTLTEPVGFLPLAFEVSSAFGTVGLSTGITPGLSTLGKLLITITMFFGRVGPLAFGLTLVGRPKPDLVVPAAADVLVG